MDSDSGLPMSPWADRYRYSGLTITEGGVKHSLLTPRNPALRGPKYYDQDPDPKGAHVPSSYKDLDRLLWSEAVQKEYMQGLRTYQLTVLNRRLMFPTTTGFRAVAGGRRRTSRLGELFSRLNLSRPLGGIRKLSGLSKASGPGKVSGIRKSYGSLGGAPRADFRMYEQGRINVDEDTWLPFLRKDRWFDWNNFSLANPTQPTVTWSVDDEELWSKLSIVIELVNRILLALLMEQHDSGKKRPSLVELNKKLILVIVILRTMIYGRWDFWDNLEDVFGPPPKYDATVLLSYAKEQVVCNKRGTNVCEFQQTVDKTVPEARDRLIQLLSKTIWSFSEAGACHAFTSYQPSVDGEDTPYTSVVCISVLTLQVMLDPDLTLDELGRLQVVLAITVIHEIMHAILSARFHDDNYIGNCIDKTKDERWYSISSDSEPYLDAEGMAEAGWYIEQSVFGGRLDISIFSEEDGLYPPLTLISEAWPNIAFSDTYTPADSNSDYLQEGVRYIIYHVPSTWPSKLLSETFWNSPAFPRKSDNFFHNPRIFYTLATVQGGQVTQTTPLRALRPNQQDSQYPETRELLADWTNHRSLWVQIRRPWYGDALPIWEESPKWCDHMQRKHALQFADAFARKSHVKCATIANNLLTQVPWADDRAEYLDRIPQDGQTSSHWAWHLIGLLMLASLPIRKDRLVEIPSPRGSWTMELAPSKDAIIAGHHRTAYLDSVVFSNLPSRLTAEVSVLYDRTRPDRGRVDDFTQLDYLALITSTIELIAQLEGTLHSRFLVAIVNAKEALLKDRELLARSYAAGHSTRWASEWPFELPEYNPECSMWNGQAWVRRGGAA